MHFLALWHFEWPYEYLHQLDLDMGPLPTKFLKELVAMAHGTVNILLKF